MRREAAHEPLRPPFRPLYTAPAGLSGIDADQELPVGRSYLHGAGVDGHAALETTVGEGSEAEHADREHERRLFDH